MGVAEILKPFDEITTDLSSQYYPSISKVIPSIRILDHPRLSFLSTKLVARMNDINYYSLTQNIVLPKQLNYIIFLRNELYKLVYFEIINAKIF